MTRYISNVFSVLWTGDIANTWQQTFGMYLHCVLGKLQLLFTSNCNVFGMYLMGK